METGALKKKTEELISGLLRNKGLCFENFEDVSVPLIRHTLRGGVPGMRVTHVTPELREKYLKKPITSELLCLRAGYHQAVPSHYLPRTFGSHDSILIYCTKGYGWVEIYGKTWTISKDMGVVIPRHVPHTYGADTENPWEVYWVHFQGEQATSYESLLTVRSGDPTIHLSQHQEFLGCFEQLYLFMNRVHSYPTLVSASGALASLLGRVYSLMRASEVRSKSAEEQLKKTIEFMQQNISQHLAIRELASVAAMNPNYYTTLFSRQFGHPPIEYFNRLKVQRACELLKSTDLLVSEIGEQLGFNDPYYFSRVFSKIMGSSPKKYR